MKKEYVIFLIIIILFVGGIIAFNTLMPKYKVYINDSNDSFLLSKKEYHYGEKVTIKVLRGTDTDYYFDVIEDDVKENKDYGSNLIKFSFIMPNHEVHIKYNSKNTMVFNPYYLIYNEDDNIKKTTYYITNNNEVIIDNNKYKLNDNFYHEIEKLIDENKLNKWNDLENYTHLNNKNISINIYDVYGDINITTDKMPENGMEVINKIKALINESIKEENKIEE